MSEKTVRGFWLTALTLLFTFAAWPGFAFATDTLLQTKELPLSLAQKAAGAALAKCGRDGYRVSVAVVDRGGNLKVLLRGDGAGPHTPDSAFKKAYTAASLSRSTLELAQLIAKVPSLQALRDMNEKILILGGGLPIQAEGAVIGGIGVGGAPGDRLDEACAREGLQAIQPQPNSGKPPG
ncbi:MAG: heme-binding protein [Nitrospinales bacterium]